MCHNVGMMTIYSPIKTSKSYRPFIPLILPSSSPSFLTLLSYLFLTWVFPLPSYTHCVQESSKITSVFQGKNRAIQEVMNWWRKLKEMQVPANIRNTTLAVLLFLCILQSSFNGHDCLRNAHMTQQGPILVLVVLASIPFIVPCFYKVLLFNFQVLMGLGTLTTPNGARPTYSCPVISCYFWPLMDKQEACIKIKGLLFSYVRGVSSTLTLRTQTY